jgi:hypothetical protein
VFDNNLVLTPKTTRKGTSAISISGNEKEWEEGEEGRNRRTLLQRSRTGAQYCVEFEAPAKASFSSTIIIGNFTNQLSFVNTPTQLVSTSVYNSAVQFRRANRGKHNGTVSSLMLR